MNRLASLNNQFDSNSTATRELTHVAQAPADPILSLSVNYKNDTFPQKVNLGIGAYRDNDGKPYVFPVVRAAEAKIVADTKLDKEYLPIEGNTEFLTGARGVLFGWDHADVNSGRVASCQTLSGTGALRVIGDFIKIHRPTALYLSNPTWGNHQSIFAAAGLEVRQYRYFDPKTKGLDIKGMIEDLKNATPGSIILLHTSAHNPTGVDPTLDQWKQIAEVMRAQQHYPFFDTAYQGFVTGDLNKDGLGLRYFVDQGFELVVAQSFAKVMGLYGERTGALHFVCADKAVAGRVLSQVKIIIRQNYSSPPAHGARIAAMILNDTTLRNQWLQELVNVTNRITDMRNALKANLIKVGAKGNWDHVTNQIGMFSFTGLTVKQSDAMVNEHHIYMTKNGRISICGLTNSNVEYVAKCIKDVTDRY